MNVFRDHCLDAQHLCQEYAHVNCDAGPQMTVHYIDVLARQNLTNQRENVELA